jgi:hypothetical protein
VRHPHDTTQPRARARQFVRPDSNACPSETRVRIVFSKYQSHTSTVKSIQNRIFHNIKMLFTLGSLFGWEKQRTMIARTGRFEEEKVKGQLRERPIEREKREEKESFKVQ